MKSANGASQLLSPLVTENKYSEFVMKLFGNDKSKAREILSKENTLEITTNLRDVACKDESIMQMLEDLCKEYKLIDRFLINNKRDLIQEFPTLYIEHDPPLPQPKRVHIKRRIEGEEEEEPKRHSSKKPMIEGLRKQECFIFESNHDLRDLETAINGEPIFDTKPVIVTLNNKFRAIYMPKK